MRIREMILADVPYVHRYGTGEQAFRVAESATTFWPVETLESWVHSEQDVSLALDDGDVKGFLLAAYHPATRKATIENTWVSSEVKYRGFGRELMAEAEERFKGVGARYLCALVGETNVVSRNMCLRQGYTKGDRFYWMHKEI